MSESAYNSPLPTRRLTESCCSSPARSIGGHVSDILTDSDGEGDVLFTEVPGAPDQTVISGWLKFRDNKKWKQRWGVITKLSPAAAVEVYLHHCIDGYSNEAEKFVPDSRLETLYDGF